MACTKTGKRIHGSVFGRVIGLERWGIRTHIAERILTTELVDQSQPLTEFTTRDLLALTSWSDIEIDFD